MGIEEKKKIPAGIILVFIFFILAACLLFLALIVFSILGSNPAMMIGIVLLGLSFLVIGIFLILARKWAKILSMILVILSFLILVFNSALGGGGRVPIFGLAIQGIIVGLIIAYLLLNKKVQEFFS